jgi:subtilisin family serine protease
VAADLLQDTTGSSRAGAARALIIGSDRGSTDEETSMRRRPSCQHPATVLAAHAVAPPRKPSVISTAALLALTLVVALVLTTRGSDLQPTAAHSPAPTYAAGRILVKFRAGTEHATKIALRNGVHGVLLSTIVDLDIRVWKVPAGAEAAAVDRLERSPHVVVAERDSRRGEAAVLPDDPYLPTGSGSYDGGEWGVFRTRTPEVWSADGYGAPGVVVAVVDSGIAGGHPDLQGQVVAGRNVLDGSTNTEDTDGHGTEVAGVIAAATDNSTGIAGFCGGCRLMPVKVTAGGSAYDSNLASGVTWAADHGARVINLSFAGSGSSSTLGNAVAYARSKGVVVVAAAGNSGCDCVTYPGNYPGVVAVGASSNLTGDVLQGYSNYGSWVDVAAPSANLTTTLTDPSTGTAWGYLPVGGTSLAAPVVAGLAGLLFSARPAATGTSVEQALVTGASPVSGAHTVATGRIDAASAYAELTGGAATSSPSPTTTPSPSPSATSTASPTPSESPSPTATPNPTATTTTFASSLNRKTPTRTFSVAAGSSVATSTSFGCPSLSVVAKLGTTALASATGPSVLTTGRVAASGTVLVTVSGSTKCSFALSVTTT